ncbi:AbrB/MazE/SpoVT family DNA-binding domain-containing protein [Candidatus Bathyarchaeota archaeon]|nr:AbrB/MazE/SpoVT family DNA-binding domain-containing protein [Candidatus Bathyarchaeota archaeon]
MGKTHADKIREAVTDLGEASPQEIMEWIKHHYPNDELNPRSYRADIIGCSVNHTSAHHYEMPRFLWFDKDSKTYRLAKPGEAYVENSKEKESKKATYESTYINGVPITKLSVTGQVTIPTAILEKLGFQAGDTLAFLIKENGILEIRKARVKLEFA